MHMKNIVVKKLPALRNMPLAEIPSYMDKAGVEYNDIANDTWKCSAHNPAVRFQITHTSDAIVLHFNVKDNEIRAHENAPSEAYSAVKRWSSLGSAPFETAQKECEWDLVEVIPLKALYQHHIDSLDGQQMRANFFKCADMISEPHFLSWAPIDLPKPCFHCPDFFGRITFE